MSRERRGPHDEDYPPNSRLFIVCSKLNTEDEFRTAFEPFGTIEDVWLVKDRATGENKGVAYVKFSKASEAAMAMEEYNGKCIGACPKPVKVLVALNRNEGSKREPNEEERLMRLFLMIPKTFSEDDLRNDFEKFGPVEYVNVIKDRITGQSKGLAYVKFHKASTAAIALENCDPSYKPKFAEPKYSTSWKERQYQEAADRSYDRDSYRPGSRDSQQDRRRGVGEGDRGLKRSLPDWNMYGSGRGLVQLSVFTPASVSPEQLFRIFDIIPGLEYCDQKGNGFAVVKYATPEAAAYAKQKLHGFEYPPDNKLIVKYSDEFSPDQWQSQTSNSAIQNQLTTLTEALSQTTALLKQAGLPIPEGLVPQTTQQTYPPAAVNRANERFVSSYCTAELPPPQPMLETEMQEAIRLFLIFSPEPPPLSALKDVFSRFGNCIDVYLISNRNVGYAKYATRESGLSAMATLHGHEIMHVRMKVVEADPPENARKKQKVSSF